MKTPVAQRTKNGIFVAHHGAAWLYRILPHDALQWEDQPARTEVAMRHMTMFAELGMTSKVGKPGMRGRREQSNLREFHLLRLAWDERLRPAEGNNEVLADWQERSFSGETSGVELYGGNGLVAFGVKLRRSVRAAQKVQSHLGELADSVMGHEIDLKVFSADFTVVSKILEKAGGRPPTAAEAHRMEFWWNGGRGTESKLVPTLDGRAISCPLWPEGIEFAAVVDFDHADMDPERGMWLNDVFSINEGCVCVSVRGDIWPEGSIKPTIRKTRRRADASIRETAMTADVDRGEDQTLAAIAEGLERYFDDAGEPAIRNASVIFARRVSESPHTYRDVLQSQWGLTTKVFELRQHDAWEETLPCGPSRFRHRQPFSQDFSVGVLATSGVTSYSEVGDRSGAWVGMAISDMYPIWLDPNEASATNSPPATVVVGESGSGKTFLMQAIATQCAMAGKSVVMINPKPDDSLASFCEAVGGETVVMSSSPENQGALDPFRFAATPANAAEIAASHIHSVLDLDQITQLHLDSGLKRSADAGARCVGDALNNERIPPEVRDMVATLCEGRPLFGQGISWTPRTKLGLIDEGAVATGSGSLTLIEFDRQLRLPQHADRSQQTRDERIGMATIRLVCNAALESMFAAGGGVLIVDEAHVLMNNSEGREIITRLGREGRSQGILPILGTQLMADIMEGDTNMMPHISRVLGLKMRDEREANALLMALKLEPTPQRLNFLATAGPQQGRGALGLFRDVQDRVSAIHVGPFDPGIVKLFSTNPLDKAERAREAELAGAAA